jgi:Protein of unknown function (DUF4231)
VPIFLLAFNDTFWGKIIPSILSAMAAAATAWLQLRKPQHLWGIYRTAQRQLENELLKFQHKLGEYVGEDRDKIFIASQIRLFEEVHSRWASILPNIDDLEKITSEPNHKRIPDTSHHSKPAGLPPR